MRRAFVVVESGVYVRNVYGPFPTCRAARTAADRLAFREKDDYHTFSVHRLYKRAGIGTCAFGTFKGKSRRTA
ncbi:hypothetical protein LCGC14_1849870 [marine sediment metagenome]|uniref:Uncharacterized protein n=1 Tax=marine sediment metagenome TaxID=412755 RepID=A0A0F9GAM4_9ZZZZ